MGKLMILKLRDDYKAKKGAAYTLQGFHDAFIKLGPAAAAAHPQGHARRGGIDLLTAIDMRHRGGRRDLRDGVRH